MKKMQLFFTILFLFASPWLIRSEVAKRVKTFVFRVLFIGGCGSNGNGNDNAATAAAAAAAAAGSVASAGSAAAAAGLTAGTGPLLRIF